MTMIAAAKVEPTRYPELDALRAIAVLAMVAYHLLFDLKYFYGFDVPIDSNSAIVFTRAVASVFLLLVGIGFAISWNRTTPARRFEKIVRRAALILGGAAAVSLVTWLLDPATFIRFGILHLIGISALFQPLFARFSYWNIAVGICLVSVSKWLHIEWPPASFTTLDFYPLFPWFGVILIGMGIADLFYIPKRHPALERIEHALFPNWPARQSLGAGGLLWIGRRALLIYLLHQPIILATLSLLLILRQE